MHHRFGMAGARKEWLTQASGDDFLVPADTPLALVLACSDCDLGGLLARLESQGASIWRTPGNRVVREVGDHLLEAQLRCGVRDVIVLGHSRCGWLARQRRQEEPAPREGMGRILRNVRQAAGLRDQAMRNVVEQLEVLCLRPGIASAVSRGAVELHGWLYLDETGLFLHYDPIRARFTPAETNA